MDDNRILIIINLLIGIKIFFNLVNFIRMFFIDEKRIILLESEQINYFVARILVYMALLCYYVTFVNLLKLKMISNSNNIINGTYILFFILLFMMYITDIDYVFICPNKIIKKNREFRADEVVYVLSASHLHIYINNKICFTLLVCKSIYKCIDEFMSRNYQIKKE